jgi:hypothetical protein
MPIVAYLDASGSSRGQRDGTISVGGFVSHEDDWTGLESDWSSLLARHGVDTLHMRDAPSAALVAEAGDTIAKWLKQSVGGSLPLKVYDDWNEQFCVAEALGTAYTLAAMSAISTARAWVDQHCIDEPLLVFLEEGDNDQPDLRRFMERLYPDNGYLRVEVVKKRWIRADGQIQRRWQFETADFLAWHQRDAVSRFRMSQGEPPQGRPAFLKVLPKPGVIETHWVYIEDSTLRNQMEVFSVPRRFNHFEGGHPLRRRWIDPLAFVSDQPVGCVIARDGYFDDDMVVELDRELGRRRRRKSKGQR